MTFKYTKVEQHYRKIVFILLILTPIIMLLGEFDSEYMRKKTLITLTIDLFAIFIFTFQILYFRRFTLVTSDRGILIIYYLRKMEYSWTEVICVKKITPGWYKLITKRGSLTFNPHGLLPIGIDNEHADNQERKIKSALLCEIKKRGSHVEFIRIPDDFLEC